MDCHCPQTFPLDRPLPGGTTSSLAPSASGRSARGFLEEQRGLPTVCHRAFPGT